MKVAVLITSLLVFLTAGTWYLSSRGTMLPIPSWLGAYGFDILIALIVLGIFSAMAYSLQVTRFYFYGFLLAFAFLDFIPYFQNMTIQVPLGLAGLVITTVGIVLLVRFLEVYPAAEGMEEN